MPAAGPQGTRAKQLKRKRKPPPPPRRYAPGPTSNAQSYVSLGRAVQRVANQQTRRAAAAPYVSQGRAVAKRAAQLQRQTRRAAPGRRVDPLKVAGRILASPFTRVYRDPTFAQASAIKPGVFQRGAADLQTLGEAPFIGGYEALLGTYEASPLRQLAQGKSPSLKRLGRLGAGVATGTLRSAPGELLTGHPGKALAVAQQHPLIAALDTAAAFSVGGKLAGAGTRLATGYKVGSTIRPPLALSNDAGAVKAGSFRVREYSKGLDRQAVQRVNDARREPVRDAEGKPVMVKQAGKSVPVLRATPGELRRGNVREADYRVARGNAAERMAREGQARSQKIKGIRGQRARDLVAMVQEGTIAGPKHIDAHGHVMTGPAAFVRYLTDHADRLDREYAARMKSDPKGFLHSGKAEANRYRAQLARDAAADPRIVKQAEKIVAEGTRQGRLGRKLDTEAVGEGVISDPALAKRAALIPGGIEHLGARHFTVEEHQRLERAAKAEETRIQDALLGVKRSGGSGPGGVDRRVMSRIPDAQRKAELTRELAAARAHRIAVSGRDPRGVVAHETARAAAESARATERSARAKIARLEKKRQRFVGAQSSRRGRRQGEARKGALTTQRGTRPEGKATAEERAKLAAVEREIKAARTAAHDAGMEARKAEHASKQTPLPPTREAVRTAEGKQLPDAAIEKFFRDRGRDPETVGYLPHRPPGNSAFHQQLRPGTRPVSDKPGRHGTRTGEAYKAGATEFSADLIQQQGVKLRTQIVKAQQLDQLVRERGLRHPEYPGVQEKAARGEQLSKAERRLLDNGGYWTGKEAAEAGQRILYDTSKGARKEGHAGLGPREVILLDGEHYLPMTAYANRLSDSTKRIIREDKQGPGAMGSLHELLLNDRLLEPGNVKGVQGRNVVLVPADTIDRYLQHLRPAGELEKLLQMVNRPFRFAVLSQFKWLVGNFVEPYFVRLPTVGSGVVNVPGMLNDIRISLKIVREGMRSGDPRVRAAAAARVADDLGGLMNNRGLSNRRLFSDTKLYAKIVQKVPATRQMFEVVHKVGQVLFAPARAFFWSNRELIEKWSQHAGLGRSERRKAVEYFGSWRKAVVFGREATEQAVKGLVDTPQQHAFAREQIKLLGQYGGFSPRLRALVQGPMPFLPWALNAARFVYWTMPTQRTILTALLVKTNDVVADEWKRQHEFLSPQQRAGTLGVDPVRQDQGITPAVRYTPYGLTAPIGRGNFEGLDYAFPAISGATAAAQGRDPFGNDLKAPATPGNPQGTVEGWSRAPVVLNALAEALVPYLAQARRIRESGETPYSTSNIFSPKTKPGTSYQYPKGLKAGVIRTLNPFRPTYVHPPAGAGQASGPGPRLSRADQILERRAQRLEGGGSSAQSRIDAILERRARRLGGG